MNRDQIRKSLSGVFAPITTPFFESGEVDYEGLHTNMKKYAASKLAGYLALGSNGENKSLTMDEKFKVLEIIVRNKGAHQTVMAGCIAESTAETIFIARKAEQIGADFITLLPPNYFKAQMTEPVLATYFADVADAVGKPCLVYNAPQFSGGMVLSTKLVKQLAAHGNIVGVKDSSNAASVDDYLLSCPENFAILAGSVNYMVSAMLNGALGGIISLGNAFPDACWKLWHLIATKQYDEGFAYNKKIVKVSRSVSGKGGVAAVKAAMDLAGLVGAFPRRPLLPLTPQARDELKAALLAEGML
jgi:4-hydroxy-2-oxoglutarate aldolase